MYNSNLFRTGCRGIHSVLPRLTIPSHQAWERVLRGYGSL